MENPTLSKGYATKEKRFYPVMWPAQAVSREHGRVVLPMGKGRQSVVLPLDLPETSRSCTLVWNNGFELHVCLEIEQAETAPGDVHATVDLGEIHLAAVTINTGKALIVTGRGIRTLKRQRTKQLRSSPSCGHKHKPRKRQWNCKPCGFKGHRDLVGSVNMHRLAFGEPVEFPRSFTSLRPGLSRSSSRADTPLCCLGECAGQPRLAETVSSEAGHTAHHA